MAIKYVWSGAGGTNDGSSWTNAWTSILSADAGATVAGDEVRVHKTHSETGTLGSASFSGGTNANPIKITCVDKDAADALSTGAAITNNSSSFAFNGAFIVNGLTITQSAGAAFSLNSNGSNSIARHRNCTFVVSGNNGLFIATTGGQVVALENCTIDLSAASAASCTISISGAVRITGGTIKARAAGHTTLFVVAQNEASLVLEGVDIQNTVTNICTISTSNVYMKRCKLPTFTNLVSTAPTQSEFRNYAFLEGCVSGTITVPPLGLTWREARTGTVKSSLTRYRTGGADDEAQANAHSWELVSSANALDGVSWLESPPMAAWVEAGSHTLTVYVASGTTFQDDELWIEVLSPSEAGSATSQARFQSSRLLERGTAANLTTDGTSSWTGTGVGTLQKIAVSIAPTVAGPVSVRVCLAKPSSTVYVDPQIEVT